MLIFTKGSITKKELTIIMKSWGLNPTKSEVTDIMNDIDDSGDGEFDFPEFIEIMAARMKVFLKFYISRVSKFLK